MTPHHFRAHYAQSILPAGYSGPRHLVIVLVAGFAAIAMALWVASSSWTAANLWTVPLTLVIANAVEYLAHRGPMHRPVRWLQAVHLRHAIRHHGYFTAQHMCFESTRDFHAVLFPPVLLLFFGAITALLGFLAALFLPRAVAALFVATGVSYYLMYELLHFLYHSPTHWRAARLPGVGYLARLHRLHHDPQLGRTSNFNLTFPLCDLLVGTLNAGAGRDTRLSAAAEDRSPP